MGLIKDRNGIAALRDGYYWSQFTVWEDSCMETLKSLFKDFTMRMIEVKSQPQESKSQTSKYIALWDEVYKVIFRYSLHP